MQDSGKSGKSFRDRMRTPAPGDDDEAGESAMDEKDEVETPEMKLKHKVGVRLRNKHRASKKLAAMAKLKKIQHPSQPKMAAKSPLDSDSDYA